MARLIYFKGHVQGVGFRITALNVAQRHQVTGWVRNLPDGRVQLLAEGQSEVLDNFLAELREQMSAYIHEEEIHEVPDEGHTVFRIVT
jgi:acylphosphatase